ATFASLGRRHDWRAAMARITAPTVVLHGATDLTPEAQTRAFAAAIPGATVEIVQDAGHFLLDEAPEAIVRAVQQATGRYALSDETGPLTPDRVAARSSPPPTPSSSAR